MKPRSFSAGPMRAQISRSRVGQLGLLGAAADMHVGARIVLGRHAVDGADRLAVDQDDALVALAHVLQVALHDEGLAEHLAEHFEQRGEVAVGLVQMEDAGAAIAVERLDDDVADAPCGRRRPPARSWVISVSGIRSGNSVTKIFSGLLRTQAGSLTTSVFGWMRSRMCVVVM